MVSSIKLTQEEYTIVRDVVNRTNRIVGPITNGDRLTELFSLRVVMSSLPSIPALSVSLKNLTSELNRLNFLTFENNKGLNNESIASCIRSLESVLPEKAKKVEAVPLKSEPPVKPEPPADSKSNEKVEELPKHVVEKVSKEELEAIIKETSSYIEGLDCFHKDIQHSSDAKKILATFDGNYFIIYPFKDEKNKNGYRFVFKNKETHYFLLMDSDGFQIFQRNIKFRLRPGPKENPISGEYILNHIKERYGCIDFKPLTKTMINAKANGEAVHEEVSKNIKEILEETRSHIEHLDYFHKDIKSPTQARQILDSIDGNYFLIHPYRCPFSNAEGYNFIFKNRKDRVYFLVMLADGIEIHSKPGPYRARQGPKENPLSGRYIVDKMRDITGCLAAKQFKRTMAAKPKDNGDEKA